jgi:hypothetical protein
LFFAVVGLSIREYLVLESKEVFHWSYVAILLFLAASLLLQLFAKNRIRQILMSIGVYYAFISILLTALIYMHF